MWHCRVFSRPHTIEFSAFGRQLSVFIFASLIDSAFGGGSPPLYRVYCTQNHRRLVLKMRTLIVIKCPNILRRNFIFIRICTANAKCNSLIWRLCVAIFLPTQGNAENSKLTFILPASFELTSQRLCTVTSSNHWTQ